MAGQVASADSSPREGHTVRLIPGFLLQFYAFFIDLCISEHQISLPGCDVGIFKFNMFKNEFISDPRPPTSHLCSQSLRLE